MNRTALTLSVTALAAATLAADVEAGFTSFVIRHDGSNVPPTIQPNNAYVPGATEFIIAGSNQKAGWGSDDLNGAKIGEITSVSITRHDDTTRFGEGSGPAVAPYFNIWITDGTKYAVVANEPSNPDFQPLFTSNGDGSKSYDLGYSDFSNKAAKVYETANAGTNNTWVHAAVGKTGQALTFADIANFVIEAPSAAYIADAANSVGGGAPRELGTNAAYGFNWVFGDTLSNYVSGAEGYVVSNPSAVPEPASLALLAAGGVLMLRRGRRA